MSDRPSELEFKLNNVVLAVSDVIEWFDLGLQLGLPSATLRLIAADPNIKDINSQRLAMLSEWLKYDIAASWEKLAAALATIGENVVAANVRSQFITDDVERNEDSDEIGVAMRRTMRGHFSTLLDKVQFALQANQVSVDRVRHFLIRYFRSSAWAQKISNLGELFDAVSVAKLWNYDHYGPLEEVIKQLLPNDSTVEKLIPEYRSQLNSYYTATKITDFIKQSNIEAAAYQDPDEPLAVHDYSFEDYRRLKVKLNLPESRKVSLSHVDQLWRSLAKEFDLPCLTAVIHSIMMGSLEVTWLILPHIAEEIVAKAKALNSNTFYHNNQIVELKIDDVIIYSYNTGKVRRSQKKLLEEGTDVNEPNDSRTFTVMSRKENHGELDIPPHKKQRLNGKENCSNKHNGCEWKGEHEQLNEHLNHNPSVEGFFDGCQYTELTCPFYICGKKFMRKDMRAHLEVHTHQEILKVSSMQSKIQELTSENEQLKHKQTQLREKVTMQEAFIQNQVAAMTQRIEGMDRQLQLATCTNDRAILPVRFNMDEYEQYKFKKKKWFSPHFWTHPQGYKMCLSVIANGEGELEGKCVSILLHMMKGKFDDLHQWPFRGIIVVQLLDQNEDKDQTKELHITDEAPDEMANRVIDGERSKKGWGRFEFIEHDDLKKGYLKDDRLCFRVAQIEANITPPQDNN